MDGQSSETSRDFIPNFNLSDFLSAQNTTAPAESQWDPLAGAIDQRQPPSQQHTPHALVPQDPPLPPPMHSLNSFGTDRVPNGLPLGHSSAQSFLGQQLKLQHLQQLQQLQNQIFQQQVSQFIYTRYLTRTDAHRRHRWNSSARRRFLPRCRT
jgi:hypothetical protein